MSMNKKLVKVLAVATAIGTIANVGIADAASTKSSRRQRTLRLTGVQSGGALLSTVVDIDTTATEYYKNENGMVVFYKRNLYSSFKVVTAALNWNPEVVKLQHMNNDGSGVVSFNDWKKENTIGPNVAYIYNYTSTTSKKYERANNKKATWNIGISSDDAFGKFAWANSTPFQLSLKCSTGK